MNNKEIKKWRTFTKEYRINSFKEGLEEEIKEYGNKIRPFNLFLDNHKNLFFIEGQHVILEWIDVNSFFNPNNYKGKDKEIFKALMDTALKIEPNILDIKRYYELKRYFIDFGPILFDKEGVTYININLLRRLLEYRILNPNKKISDYYVKLKKEIEEGI